MKTEEEIIYTIWDIVRGAEVNSDDPINERLMRQFLRIHRGRILNEYYKKGNQIPDECFQSLDSIGFTRVNNEWVSQVIPKTIKFSRGNFGFIFSKNGYPISLVNSEEFYTLNYDLYGKYHPRLKIMNEKLFLNIGMEQNCNQGLDDSTNTLHNTTVRALASEGQSNNINIQAQAVLVDPDDESGYDFTNSAYPMPDELIETLINSVNAREFNLFLRMKSDEKGDGRHNVAEHNTREES